MNRTNDFSRYVRQMRYPPFGEQGQQRLSESRALIVGCGALGTVLASTLVRAGVGSVRIVDRDFVEISNLQRQVLFDEDDVAAQMPKAIAAADKLRRVNSEIEIEPIVADVEPANIESFCDGVDTILDGTDNFEIRFLINDVAVRREIPWIYGGCIGAEGQTMTILPGKTPCLRCLMQECPPPGTTPTCDTAGILAPIINVIASIEASEAIKILSGNREAVSPYLTVVELWDNRIREVDVSALREQVDCRTCKQYDFSWLAGKEGSRSAVLCGRNSVQLTHPETTVALDELEQQLQNVGQVSRNPFLLRLKVDQYEITVFTDGRAIVGGTDDVAIARTVYAKYIGS
ncbi:MAG TPA: ThiF family adenylyltransferase [Thermoguttaceae bacterium]|nr:ThiF family adenylyltransferase [Thermoguttaceae bacterium]